MEDVKDGWKFWKEEFKLVLEKFNKFIFFIEYGYRSLDFVGKEFWDSNYELLLLNFEV